MSEEAKPQPHISAHLERKGWLHVHELVTAFAVGVLTADPWHRNYQVPPHLEKVLNHIAKRVCETFARDEVVELSLGAVEAFWQRSAEEVPEYLAWSDWPGHPPDAIHFRDRYTPTPEKRDFIDLGALIRNGSVYLRNNWDRDEAFDRDFERTHGKLRAEDA